MNLTFENGTSRQKAQWEQALNSLLSLPMDLVPLSISVKFVDPDEVTSEGDTDLALTTWTYDSPSSSTKVRDDAPGYGDQQQSLEALAAGMGLAYNADLHYNETVIHEFAHSLFAALPEEQRIRIAQLFGAKGDSIEELQPKGSAWEDRIMEGIAETFKEAFLPRRFRVFPNRTNHQIPYNLYPEFRSLWRLAVPEVSSGVEIPSYDFDIFKHGGWTSSIKWPDERGGLYVGRQGTLAGAGWTFYSKADFQIPVTEVRGGHKFKLEWPIIRALFEENAETFTGGVIIFSLEVKDDSGFLARWKIQWETFWIGRSDLEKYEKGETGQGEAFLGYTKVIKGEIPAEDFFFAWFGNIDGKVGLFPGEPEGAIVNPPTLTGGTGKREMIPPLTLTNEFEFDWPVSELKEPTVKAWLHYIVPGLPQATYVALLREHIPELPFKQSGAVPGEGEAIILPAADLQSTGFSRGSHPTKQPVAGSLG